MIAAAKLGLAGGGVRRCSSLATRSGEANLYLCFRELSPYDRKTNYGYGDSTYVVRRIDLNDSDCKELPVEAYITSHSHCWSVFTPCTRLASRIIIPSYSPGGVKDFCWTDTAKRPMNFEVISPLDHSLRSTTSIPPVREMKMAEIDGNLYLAEFSKKNLFTYNPKYKLTEIYDPVINLFTPLDPNRHPASSDVDEVPPRPIARDYRVGWVQAVFFAESKKIVAVSYHGTRCFDVAHPDIGWVKVEDQYLERRLSWLDTRSHLIAHSHHNAIGDFNIVFYLPVQDPPKICAFFVPDSCASGRPIHHTIELPGVCSDDYYTREEQDSYAFDYEFVNLGPKKFGLVLNQFTHGPAYKKAPNSVNSVLLVTYEYDIIVTPVSAQDNNSTPNVDIKSRLLGIRTFHYEAAELPPTDIMHIDLIGAFLIPENTGK